VCAVRRLVAAAVVGGVLAAGITLAVVPHGGGPRACSHPSLPSGDAMAVTVNARGEGSAWSLPHAGREFVCTDGVWVAVTHYGN